MKTSHISQLFAHLPLTKNNAKFEGNLNAHNQPKGDFGRG